MFKRAGIDVGSHDGGRHLPEFAHKMLSQHDRQAEGLFTTGTAETPDAQRFVGIGMCRCKKCRNNLFTELIKQRRIPKELADMNRQCLLKKIQLLLALTQRSAVLRRVTAACGSHPDGNAAFHTGAFIRGQREVSPRTKDGANIRQFLVTYLGRYRECAAAKIRGHRVLSWWHENCSRDSSMFSSGNSERKLV